MYQEDGLCYDVQPMSQGTYQSASDLLARVRALEDEGQVNEAIALAREGAVSMPAAYDWSGEIVRLETEGKLARPYREGVEALGEGDHEDALRLLSWVSGKNPRYREVPRYLYWASQGRDPDAPRDEDDAPPPSLLQGGSSPLSSPVAWGLALLFGLMGFGLGWTLSPSEEAPPAVAAPAPAPAVPPASAPAAPEPVPEAPPAAPVEAPPATVETAPAASETPAKSTAGATTTRARATSGGSVSDVENPSLMSEADQLALNCQGGSASACFKVGDSYYFGRGVPKDVGAAVRHYSRACELGEARGCYNAADMVEKGEAGPKDKAKAMSLFDKGCKLGDAQSCSRKSFLEMETVEVP